MIKEIKNLSIINLNKIFILANNETNLYCLSNNIDNKKDKNTLFKHFFYNIFLNVYKTHTKQNIMLYFQDNVSDDINKNNIIIKHLKHKFKFPFLISNISFDNYFQLIVGESPEYDELINNNFSMIDIFNKFEQYLKKSGLLFLNEKYNKLDEKVNLLITKE